MAIAAAFMNLGIHVALTPMHLSEMPYIGVLFVIASGLLGVVVVGLASDRDRLRTAAWMGGSAVCAAAFIAFVISRTSGLPLGYHEAWMGAIEDLLGLTCLFLELVFLGCAAISLSRQERVPTAGRTRTWMPLHDRTASLP
ncbi:MAG: hypothetical protein ACREQM_08185 [Candidatus Dormibacteraceae bacterium]